MPRKKVEVVDETKNIALALKALSNNLIESPISLSTSIAVLFP